MQLLRICGAVVLFASCVAASASVNSARRARLRTLDELIAFIGHIKEQIRCFGTPCSEIFARYDSDALRDCGFLAFLRESRYDEAVSTLGNGPERAVAFDFFTKLGHGYADGELRLCEYASEALAALRSRLSDEYPGAARTCTALGTLAGICAAIFCL